MEQYEINWKDYYGILGVSPSAEPEVVKAAYNAMARKYHPDTGGDAGRMKEINEAWEVLSSPERRALYDGCRRAKQQSSNGNTGGAGARSHDARSTGSSAGAGSSSSSRARYRYAEPQVPVERPGVLPWPSWGWQRTALFCSVPLGLGLTFANFGLWFTLAGFLMLGVSIYAVAGTRGLGKVGGGWSAARVSAGFCITASLCVLGAAVLVLGAIALVFMGITAAVKSVW